MNPTTVVDILTSWSINIEQGAQENKIDQLVFLSTGVVVLQMTFLFHSNHGRDRETNF